MKEQVKEIVDFIKDALQAPTHEANDYNCADWPPGEGCSGCKGDKLREEAIIKLDELLALLSPKGEKPPIMYEDAIRELKVDNVPSYVPSLMRFQRDADAAYYEPLIQQKQNVIDDASNKLGEVEEKLVELIQKQKALTKKLDDVELAIQQARQEGRDDVLAILENDYPEEAQSIKQALKGSKEKMK